MRVFSPCHPYYGQSVPPLDRSKRGKSGCRHEWKMLNVHSDFTSYSASYECVACRAKGFKASPGIQSVMFLQSWYMEHNHNQSELPEYSCPGCER